VAVGLQSDEALVKRLLPKFNADADDRAQAWREWYTRLGEAAVMAFIRVKNDSSESNMDIFQEAMLTAYVEIEQDRYQPCPGIPLTAYVKGIAYNKIREARRRGRRSGLIEETLQSIGEASVAPLESVIEKRELRRALRSGLATLSGGRRQVLERYLQGHNTAEIAYTLGMSEALVRQHKCRGLATLRTLDSLVQAN
jgi:RNA polymerase sigma factor (sigma-70 family)